jgi:hypothetical protein
VTIKIFRFAALIFFLATGNGNVSAQVYNGIIGYVPCVFMTGSNLFNNPLQSGANTLGELFNKFTISGGPTITNPPTGTIVSLWNPTNSSFGTSSIFTNGSWTINMTLPPGTGALLITPKPFTNTIMGVLLDHNGILVTNDTASFPPPSVFSGPNGTYLLGDKSPFIDTGTDIFLNIIGRVPFIGEKVTLLSGTSTYLGNGVWDSIPTLAVGQADFLTIMSEPPPALTIINTNNLTIVSWSSSASPWALQTNSDLVNGTWENYAGSITNNSITNSSATGNLFFRLSYP